MTEQLQLLTIAQYLGWEPCEPRVFVRHAPSHAFMYKGAYYGGLNSLPRYTEDLNLMHEVEKTLTNREAGDYDAWLWIIIKRDWEVNRDNNARITTWHATAAQKVEAFLRVKGLWVRDAEDKTEPPNDHE